MPNKHSCRSLCLQLRDLAFSHQEAPCLHSAASGRSFNHKRRSCELLYMELLLPVRPAGKRHDVTGLKSIYYSSWPTKMKKISTILFYFPVCVNVVLRGPPNPPLPTPHKPEFKKNKTFLAPIINLIQKHVIYFDYITIRYSLLMRIVQVCA